MAVPFFEQPKSLSVEALALLLFDTPPEEVIRSAGLKKISFPAFCPGTGEHTLIFGFALQLGDKLVQWKFQGKISTPDCIQTQVFKLQICQEYYHSDWSTFVQAPIKDLVHCIESLQMCSVRTALTVPNSIRVLMNNWMESFVMCGHEPFMTVKATKPLQRNR